MTAEEGSVTRPRIVPVVSPTSRQGNSRVIKGSQIQAFRICDMFSNLPGWKLPQLYHSRVIRTNCDVISPPRDQCGRRHWTTIADPYSLTRGGSAEGFGSDFVRPRSTPELPARERVRHSSSRVQTSSLGRWQEPPHPRNLRTLFLHESDSALRLR